METSKKNPKLSLVKPQQSVKKQKKLNNSIKDLEDAIESLGNCSHLQDDPNFVLHVMNLVENISNVKLTGQEKKDLVIEKIFTIFPLNTTEQDRERLGKLIDFLCSQKMVKAISTTAVIASSVCGFLLKKALA